MFYATERGIKRPSFFSQMQVPSQPGSGTQKRLIRSGWFSVIVKDCNSLLINVPVHSDAVREGNTQIKYYYLI